MILSCNNIGKSFGTDQILKGVSFHINEQEKVALVGVNGAGKSTLLKIIMKEHAADEGEVIAAKGITIGYLEQNQGLSSENTIYEEILTGKEEIILLGRQIRDLEHAMKSVQGQKLEEMLQTYSRLTHKFEALNGYRYQSEINGILKGLGFLEEEFSKKVSTLSGGQKTRIALGKLLLSKPDLILLDEPTNHLDLESIAWLETYLLNYKGSVVIVAHDRYFLDKVVSKVIELDHTKATMYSGNYTEYAKKKAVQRESIIKQYYNQQREMKRQEEVIAKLRSFNREKSIKRAESREKLLEKVERLEKPIEEENTISIHLEPRIQSGNDVLSAANLSKKFENLVLFQKLNFDIKRKEKVALLGKNGTGKTTILKIITGLLHADQGEIKLGSKVKIGYYDQEHQVLNMEKTIFDELQDAYPSLNNTQIRNILAAFLFTNDDVFKQIKDLSGGERGRVSLAKLMLSEANFLILDEPTNHLDITSKEILEHAINQYTGTVLYVSHDRYFINRTATRILDLSGGRLVNYLGNYDYYMEKKPVLDPTASLTSSSCANESENKLDWRQQKEEQAKIRKRQNEIKKIENDITALETREEEIDLLLTNEEIYTNAGRLLELNQEKKSIETRLEMLMERWEYLSESE